MNPLLLQPDILAAFARMYVHRAVMQTTWYFDALFSFLVAFAVTYALFLCLSRLIPARTAARPRAWAVPLLFAVVALAFPLADRLVATAVWDLQSVIGAAPEEWLVSGAACVWLAGCAVTLLRTLRGFFALRRAARTLPPYADLPCLATARAAAGLGAVTLRNGGPRSPIISCGVWRPCIVVPEDFARRFTPAEQHTILLHECIHLRHRDPLKLLLLALAAAVFWFDPVSRHALRRTRADLEHLCDWTALTAHGLDPASYAALVLAAAEGSDRARLAPAFSDPYRLLAQRLSRFLGDASLRAPSRGSLPADALITAALTLLTILSALNYAATPAFPPSQPVVDGALETVCLAERRGLFGHYVYGVTTSRDHAE